LVGLIVACLFMPIEFFEVYDYISMVGAFFFMIIQMVMLIDFAYDMQNEWVGKMEEEETGDGHGKWFYILLACVIVFYICALVICILLYVFFTQPQYDGGCSKRGLNIMFITLNIIIAVILSLLSVSSFVREKNQNAGLLQSSVFALYCAYLVFSAIISEPIKWLTGCNKIMYVDDEPSRSRNWTDTASQIIGGILTIAAVFWSTLRSSKVKFNCCSDEESDEDEGAGDADLEEDTEVPYSYSYFHLIYTLGSMYVSQLLTNWRVVSKKDDSYTATENGVYVDSGKASVWIKIVASWLVSFMYLWSLVAPRIFSNRDFS